MDQIVEVKELCWGFDKSGPYVNLGTAKWPTQVYVDPAPGYSHQRVLVQEMLDHCQKLFPLPTPPTFYLLSNDGIGGTSAETRGDRDWDRKNEFGNQVPQPWVIMFGKRIPLHPAMTRYLVAHEYGHCVEHFLCAKRGDDSTEKNRVAYAKLRGVTPIKYYGPQSWHTASTEIFANDFRLLICGVETEFWPHDVPRPQDVPEVVAFWDEVKKLDLTPGPCPPEKS